MLVVIGTLSDRFRTSILESRVSPMGRFELAGPGGTGRSQSAVAQHQHVGQLSHALLTLMAALASGLDVGLMALGRRTPSCGDRLLTLRTRRRVALLPGW